MEVHYVERNHQCSRFVKEQARILNISTLHLYKSDVFTFLKSTKEKFNLIFADPPYDTEDAKHTVNSVFEKDILEKNGMLIVEHSNRQNLNAEPNFRQVRKYGNVCFSFFHEFDI